MWLSKTTTAAAGGSASFHCPAGVASAFAGVMPPAGRSSRRAGRRRRRCAAEEGLGMLVLHGVNRLQGHGRPTKPAGCSPAHTQLDTTGKARLDSGEGAMPAAEQAPRAPQTLKKPCPLGREQELARKMASRTAPRGASEDPRKPAWPSHAPPVARLGIEPRTPRFSADLSIAREWAGSGSTMRFVWD